MGVKYGVLNCRVNINIGRMSEKGANRVNRGGSWNNNARNCRSANRNNNTPDNRNNNLGFRLLSTQMKKGQNRPVHGWTGRAFLCSDIWPAFRLFLAGTNRSIAAAAGSPMQG